MTSLIKLNDHLKERHGFEIEEKKMTLVQSLVSIKKYGAWNSSGMSVSCFL